jgi:hypothetical protein
VRGGDRGAGRARPAGLARLREAINSRLEVTSFRTGIAICAPAVLLIVAIVVTALLVSGQGTAGGRGTAAEVAPGSPAGTSAAMPTASPRPPAIAFPTASPVALGPSASAPAARPTVSVRSTSPPASPVVPVRSPSPSATSSPSRCPPGLAKHHRCGEGDGGPVPDARDHASLTGPAAVQPPGGSDAVRRGVSAAVR